MKRYTLTLGQIVDGYTHPHPERTARRVHGNGDDFVFQVWPSRAAMLTTIRMQAKCAPGPRDWKPLQP